MKRMNSRVRILATLALLGCLGSAAPAFGQTYSYYPSYGPDRPVQWFVNGGGTITQGQTSTYFNDGGTFGGGLILRPYPQQPFALRFDVNYSYFSANNAFISAAGAPGNDAYMETLTGFVDGVLEAPVSPWARLYFMGGVGLGWRGIYLGQGGYYCNPFGYCGSGYGYSGNHDTDFAWNAGLGMNFPMPGGSSWFIEARYERIETSNAPTEFIPIRVGFRF